jgi:hypothetical protein
MDGSPADVYNQTANDAVFGSEEYAVRRELGDAGAKWGVSTEADAGATRDTDTGATRDTDTGLMGSRTTDTGLTDTGLTDTGLTDTRTTDTGFTDKRTDDSAIGTTETTAVTTDDWITFYTPHDYIYYSLKDI